MNTILFHPKPPPSAKLLSTRPATFSPETVRLSVLHAYRVLDTPPEEEFDALTRLASYIAGTPIALISLLDEQRQWFKSKVGVSLAQTPRSQALCHYTIQGKQTLEVPDAHLDERFVNNPLVTGDPQIRYYCGVPLTTPEGQVLGSLCVIDQKPRQLDQNQQAALQTLAGEIMTRLELRRKNYELADKNRQLAAQKLELANNEERYRSLFEESEGYLFTHCLEGKILDGNRAASLALGYPKEQLIGQSIRELLGLKSAFLLEEYLRQVAMGKPVTGVTRIVTARGEERFWQYRNFLTCTVSGEPYVICSAQDVTDKEMAAQNLRKAKQVLEEQVQLRTGELQTANTALMQTKDNLAMFLYRASHDLKGPLCSVEGLLNLVELETKPDQQQKYIQLMGQTVRKLNRVLESLLAYSINTHWGVNQERIDFQSLLGQVLENLREQHGFGSLRISTHLNTLVPFYSDADRIFQVLKNIISNSIAFQDGRKEDPAVSIWVKSTLEGVTLLVQDNGIGIAPERLSPLFEPFSKASEQSKGSGLGLFVCREILEKLGGNITVQSRMGEGTQVNIKIPVAGKVTLPE